jgi:hypothetical protein
MVAAAVLAASVSHAAAPCKKLPSSWSSADYNPRSANDDLVLPMACGGAMAFRKIDVPGNTEYGDRTILIGDADHGGQHRVFVAGAFRTDDKPNSSHFFLAKYEMSQAQFLAAQGKCDELARLTPPDRSLPQANITLAEARAAATAFTAWLSTQADACVPRAGAYLAHTRLPTEAEWEYAARGGTSVTDAQFGLPAPPLPDGKERTDYARLRVLAADSNTPKPIGSLSPDALGLHDMLGNVAEYMDDGYSFIIGGRQHGQTGAAIAKGGHFGTYPDQVGVGLRDEIQVLDRGGHGPVRLNTVGLRLVLSAPFQSSEGQVKAWAEKQAQAAQLPGRDVETSVGHLATDLRKLANKRDMPNEFRGDLAFMGQELEQVLNREKELTRENAQALLLEGATLAKYRTTLGVAMELMKHLPRKENSGIRGLNDKVAVSARQDLATIDIRRREISQRLSREFTPGELDWHVGDLAHRPPYAHLANFVCEAALFERTDSVALTSCGGKQPR